MLAKRLTSCSDEELLRRADKGDDDAFAIFYRRHHPHLLSYFRTRTAGKATWPWI